MCLTQAVRDGAEYKCPNIGVDLEEADVNVFHHFMQGAARAAIERDIPLIDEDLDMVIDSGFIFMIEFPDVMPWEARAAGKHRVAEPMTYNSNYRCVD